MGGGGEGGYERRWSEWSEGGDHCDVAAVQKNGIQLGDLPRTLRRDLTNREEGESGGSEGGGREGGGDEEQRSQRVLLSCDTSLTSSMTMLTKSS